MDIKSNKNSPKQLTPVTIMVVDTISSVKSRICEGFVGFRFNNNYD